MSRISLAFSCFFKLLFGKNLPSEANQYLSLPPGEPKLAKPAPNIDATPKVAAPKPESQKQPKQNRSADRKDGALALLGLFQRQGRLVDFLQENIEDYDDADIGAAVRDIHRGCQKILKDHLQIEAVMPGTEDEKVKVPSGFDPSEVKLVGKVDGNPPFSGILRHHGWRATKVKLPTLSEGMDRHVVAPAEVEIGL